MARFPWASLCSQPSLMFKYDLQNRNLMPPCTNRGVPVVTRLVTGSLPTAYVELKRFSTPRKISPAVASGKGIGRQRFTLATKKALETDLVPCIFNLVSP